MNLPLTQPAYVACLLAGLALSAWYWSKRFKTEPRMALVYVGGLVGALAGAKIGYFAAEAPLWWGDDHFMERMLVGKTVLGSLLLGYAGVELGKKLAGITRPTGDAFACIAPFGMAIGRVGCLLGGCCLGCEVDHAHWWTLADAEGHAHYPAPAVELGFNLALGCVLVVLAKKRKCTGNLFHLYLIAYGLFRFGHEFVRDTPRYPGTVISPYMGLALGCAVLGILGMWRRRKTPQDHSDTATPIKNTN